MCSKSFIIIKTGFSPYKFKETKKKKRSFSSLFKMIFFLVLLFRFLGLKGMRKAKETTGLLPPGVSLCSICLKTGTSDVAGVGGTWKSGFVTQQTHLSTRWRVTRPYLQPVAANPTCPCVLSTRTGSVPSLSRATSSKTRAKANRSQRSSSASTTSCPLRIRRCLGSGPPTVLFTLGPQDRPYMSWSPSTLTCTSGLCERKKRRMDLVTFAH